MMGIEAAGRTPHSVSRPQHGSSDRTPEILAKAAREIPWLQVVRRSDRGYRKVGGGVIDAFYAGLEAADVEYDFISKMDVDLEFSPRYLK
jgi:glycosyltransferase involved in cell wall biosynthesis